MPSEISFRDIRSLLQSHGWVLERIKGSHHVFTKQGEWPISIPVHRGRVKQVYVREIKKKLEKDQQQES